VADASKWGSVAALGDVVVASAALVALKPSPGHETGRPSRLLSDALQAALTARGTDGQEAAGAASRCFDVLVRPYRQLATTGVRAEFAPPLWEDALVAAGWLALAAFAVAEDRTQGADEAGRNCLDACVRLHVFTGRPASHVQVAYREAVALRRKGLGES
jgi:hypothetical protein